MDWDVGHERCEWPRLLSGDPRQQEADGVEDGETHRGEDSGNLFLRIGRPIPPDHGLGQGHH